MAKSWFYLKDEQLCKRPGCCSPLGRAYPAYFDGLCAFCYAGADPAEKATALLLHEILHEKRTLAPPEFHGLQTDTYELPEYLRPIARLLAATGRF